MQDTYGFIANARFLIIPLQMEIRRLHCLRLASCSSVSSANHEGTAQLHYLNWLFIFSFHVGSSPDDPHVFSSTSRGKRKTGKYKMGVCWPYVPRARCPIPNLGVNRTVISSKLGITKWRTSSAHKLYVSTVQQSWSPPRSSTHNFSTLSEYQVDTTSASVRRAPLESCVYAWSPLLFY